MNILGLAEILKKIVAAVFWERIVTILTRVVDVLMIYLLWNQFNPVLCFIVVTPVYLLLCVLIVRAYDYAHDKTGRDFLMINYFNDLSKNNSEDLGRLEKAVRWIVRRRLAIFWIGSWFQLDPDVVTLLLRDRHKTFYRNMIDITLPSVTLSMTVWTSVYWFGIKFLGWTWDYLI